MAHWAGRLRTIVIFAALVAAVAAPMVASGYADARRADTAYEEGSTALAAKYYRSASLKLPWESRLQEQLAIMEIREGNPAGAVSIYESLRRRGSLSIFGWQYLGAYYCSHGDCRQALDVWFAGLAAYPSQPRFLSLIEDGYAQLGDYSNQRVWLAKWIATGQATPRDHFMLAVVTLTSDPQRAQGELAQAVSMDAAYAPAVKTLDASLDLAAHELDDSRRLVILGRGLGLVDQWPLAEQAFDEATRADKRNAQAWAWLGEARQHTGKDGKAALDIAVSLDPTDTLVHALRGLYWKRQANYPMLLAEYQVVAGLEPRNPEWKAALGEAYSLNGDLVAALAAYQDATALAPDNPTYWALLAMFSADNGVQVLDVGLPAAQKAVDIAPEDPQALDALGWTLTQAGLLYSAEQTLNKAVQMAPDLASAHLHLAEMFLRKGDQSSAYRELKRVSELDPDGPVGAYATQLLGQFSP